VKVGKRWTESVKRNFIREIKRKKGNDTIYAATLIKRNKLYGFDGGEKHQFIKIEFNNYKAFRKVSKLWYHMKNDESSSWGKRYVLNKTGYYYRGENTRIYESKIPPLLRYFHIQNISPSGWIRLPKNKITEYEEKITISDIECCIDMNDIISLPKKETPVPIKICNFDIEASSSHGDFPLAKKTYEKLAVDIISYWEEYEIENPEQLLTDIIMTAFGYDNMENVNRVYPKRQPTKIELNKCIIRLLGQSYHSERSKIWEKKEKKRNNIINFLENKTISRSDKLDEIKKMLKKFPSLKGDMVTFIGSSFIKNGEKEPYLNHCIVLGDCASRENIEMECYETERECLLAWQRLIQRENPDIVAGYNICGFDYSFMIGRSEETNCKNDFLKMSRNVDEICSVKKSSIKIASGVHELEYIEMKGRIPLDLYNYFRREYNLSSYKLDNVASYFISDTVKDYEVMKEETKIYSNNLMGLKSGNYICFEITGYSSEKYKNGKKFQVKEVGDKWFIIKGKAEPDKTKYIKWCLAKDDVTPHDIFRLSNGTKEDKAIVMVYCIMDCKLCGILLNKIDILTGFVEIASICSIPISYVVLRGQGIKLLSFIGKKCREKETLLPDIEKGNMNSWYEGAICLDPKCDLYLEDPVACVDYSSLYPSSMISENISHDSKVLTKIYDLKGNLLSEEGNREYDNLDGYKYVNIEFDTYERIRKKVSSAEEKIKTGKKVCRYAQYPNNKKAIMPSILEELLSARKATRTLIKYKTVTLNNDRQISGLLKKTEKYHIINDKGKTEKVKNEMVKSVKDTYNDFMKNIFDKRQQGFKITANSLYGGCGAKTSAFYDPDIAASTTAVGRKLLLYAKRVIEEIYKNRICKTLKYGEVKTKADCIYGDTDSCFFTFNLEDLSGNKIKGKKALEITIELAQEVGELATKMLKSPHDLEYEKTFLPFALLSKKRYVGMLYEFDPNKCKRKSMGIVLKRRDNAPIVKDIYGGIIDILMKKQNVNEAVDFAKECINKMIDGKYSLEKLIITKSLRGFYKNPKQIAHKVLADRMGKRDPGNKPSTGTRIPFIYIQTKGKKKLQGERIETPTFIKKNKLKPDYLHYITNQILKPILQIFALPCVMNNIPSFKRKKRQFEIKMEYLRQNLSYDKFVKKKMQLKNEEVKEIIFSECLRRAINLKNGNRSIQSFFNN